MPEQSRMHFYLNWAKERIDEMDATLASLEAKASQVQADSNVKANELIADLQKRRDEFQAAVKKQTEAGEAAWQRTKAQLEFVLNGRVRGAAAPAADVTPIATNRLSPEVLEPVRRQLGVAHRVLNVLVAEPSLQRPGVVAGDVLPR